MKRKFSLSLAPLQKTPSKAENQRLKQVLTTYGSLDNISPPSSPFVDRQRIDSRTEAALRSACSAVVSGMVIPSEPHDTHRDHHDGHRDHRRDGERRPVRAAAERRAPAEPSVAIPKELRARLDEECVYTPFVISPQKLQSSSTKPAAGDAVKDGAQKRVPSKLVKRQTKSQTNLKSPPAEQRRLKTTPAAAAASPYVDPRSPVSARDVASPTERPRTSPGPDSSDVSYATPFSASTTGRALNNASTAVTSAAMTPARPSKRGSSQMAAAGNGGDQAQAAQRDADHKHQQQNQPQGEADPQAREPGLSRSGSRARSFSVEIRDFLRPRSSCASRTGTRPPSRDAESRSSSALGRRPSFTGSWRTWGLRRTSSKSSIGDGGRAVDPAGFQANDRKELNLNRELPPLPSIDTWQDPDAPKKPAGTHIAALVRPKSSCPDQGAPRAQVLEIPAKNERHDSHNCSKLPTPVVVPPPPKTEEVDDGSTTTRSHPSASSHSKSSSQSSTLLPSSAASVSPAPRSIDVVKAAERFRNGEPAVPGQPHQHPVFSPRKESLAYRAASNPIVKNANASKSTSSVNEWAPSNAVAVSMLTTTVVGGPATQSSTPLPPASISSRPATRAGDGSVTNFSRKISYEQNHRPSLHESRLPTANVTALPPVPQKSKRNGLAGLRRALSSMNFGGNGGAKQRDQQQPVGGVKRVELDGVKKGDVVYSDIAVGTTAVRC